MPLLGKANCVCTVSLLVLAWWPPGPLLGPKQNNFPTGPAWGHASNSLSVSLILSLCICGDMACLRTCAYMCLDVNVCMSFLKTGCAQPRLVSALPVCCCWVHAHVGVTARGLYVQDQSMATGGCQLQRPGAQEDEPTFSLRN